MDNFLSNQVPVRISTRRAERFARGANVMSDDAIVKEIHEARERLLDRFGEDLDAYLDHLKERESQKQGSVGDETTRKQARDEEK